MERRARSENDKGQCAGVRGRKRARSEKTWSEEREVWRAKEQAPTGQKVIAQGIALGAGRSRTRPALKGRNS
ncbi:MAG: hypothetical protein CV087_10335 [Candidatus Brocadia sp. WS118]|nr:MAG: hypothetical protein CV087_10335 [Candidatus Brocadia sp. WS118]